jgi:hypothetical protein
MKDLFCLGNEGNPAGAGFSNQIAIGRIFYNFIPVFYLRSPPG